MLRDRRLSQFELINYLLGNVGATLDELLENPDSRRMCERLGYLSYPRFAERSRFRLISQIATRWMCVAHPTSSGFGVDPGDTL